MRQILLLTGLIALLSARAASADSPELISLALSSASVVGGASVTGTVQLATAAPRGGVALRLTSSNASIAAVPTQVVVPGGATTASFTITTTPVNANVNVVPPGFEATIAASHVTRGFPTDRVTRSANLRVLPPAVISIGVFSPVVGSKNTACLIRLNGAAPSGGATVHLSSTHPSLVDLPASISVPAGERDFSFSLPTHLVPATTNVVITARRGAFNSVKCTLTLKRATFTFKVLAAISSATASYYGGLTDARLRIRTQIDTVNARFNRNSPFIADHVFVVDSIYQFSGSPLSEVTRSHPNQHYKVVYDGFPTQGGGWYGSQYQAIHHSWSVTESGGTFGANATDGLVHEFGHSRGAVDLYALNVSAANNPINATSYSAGTSVMNYPYGIRIWDMHSVQLINRNAGRIVANHDYITSIFPSAFKVRIRNAGQAAPGATYAIHPVAWYSNTVKSSTVASGTLDANGSTVTLGSNPYRLDSDKPWGMRYCNLLVKVTHMSRTSYRWVPLDSVQMYALAHPGAPYTITIDVNPQASPSRRSIEQTVLPAVVARPAVVAESTVSLAQIYPNPATSHSTLELNLMRDADVSIKVFDRLGRERLSVLEERRAAGTHRIGIDATRLEPGTYFARVESDGSTTVRTLTVTR